MKSIYLGVNYNSSSTLREILPLWARNPSIEKIYIVDSFSSDEELLRTRQVCIENNATLIEAPNKGYGAALNLGLNSILKSHSLNKSVEEFMIFLGNIDIKPEKLYAYDSWIDEDAILVPKILQEEKQLNPMLTVLQNRFVWIACMSSKYNIKILLYLWILVKKVLAIFPSRIYAVHGSLFILTLSQVKRIHPIFNEKVFLYCEEMFFALAVQRNRMRYKKIDLVFRHVGAVSTGKLYQNKQIARFENWRKSMNIYCETRKATHAK